MVRWQKVNWVLLIISYLNLEYHQAHLPETLNTKFHSLTSKNIILLFISTTSLDSPQLFLSFFFLMERTIPTIIESCGNHTEEHKSDVQQFRTQFKTIKPDTAYNKLSLSNEKVNFQEMVVGRNENNEKYTRLSLSATQLFLPSLILPESEQKRHRQKGKK